MKIRTIIIFIFSANLIHSQIINLIPNGDFEDSVLCSNNWERPNSWFPPSDGSPDYFGINDTGGCTLPQSFWGGGGFPGWPGYQMPYSGNHYVGFSGGEYMEIKLNDSLKAGKRYCLEFFISLADLSGLASDGVGISLSNDSVAYHGFGPGEIPSLIFTAGADSGVILNDTMNWIAVRDTFIATGGEKYLIFGHVRFYSQTTFATTSGQPGLIYYYADDISLYYCDSPDSITEPTYSTFSLLPNPGNGNFYLNGNFPSETKMKIYNMLGQLVLSEDIESGNRSVPVFLELAAGVYVYRVESGNDVLKNGKLVIEK